MQYAMTPAAPINSKQLVYHRTNQTTDGGSNRYSGSTPRIELEMSMYFPCGISRTVVAAAFDAASSSSGKPR